MISIKPNKVIKPNYWERPNYSHPLCPDFIWLFNEFAGTTCRDLGINSSDQTFAAGASSPAWANDYVTFGSGVEYLTGAHSTIWDRSDTLPITIITKLKTTFNVHDQFVFSKNYGSGATKWWALLVYTGGNFQFWWDDGVAASYATSGSTAASNGLWHIGIGMRQNGGQLRCGIDGVLDDSGGTAKASSADNTGILYTGSRLDLSSSRDFVGEISFIYAYLKELSLGEIQEISKDNFCFMTHKTIFASTSTATTINHSIISAYGTIGSHTITEEVVVDHGSIGVYGTVGNHTATLLINHNVITGQGTVGSHTVTEDKVITHTTEEINGISGTHTITENIVSTHTTEEAYGVVGSHTITEGVVFTHTTKEAYGIVGSHEITENFVVIHTTEESSGIPGAHIVSVGSDNQNVYHTTLEGLGTIGSHTLLKNEIIYHTTTEAFGTIGSHLAQFSSFGDRVLFIEKDDRNFDIADENRSMYVENDLRINYIGAEKKTFEIEQDSRGLYIEHDNRGFYIERRDDGFDPDIIFQKTIGIEQDGDEWELVTEDINAIEVYYRVP